MTVEKDKGSMVCQIYCIADELIEKGYNANLAEGQKPMKPCGSSDAFTVYEHEDDSEAGVHYDAHCFSCKQNFSKSLVHRSSVASQLGIEGAEEGNYEVTKKKKFKKQPKAEPMKRSEIKQMILEHGFDSNNYRGIMDKYSQFYGHLSKINDKGEVLARYYPETVDYKVTGYKCRNHPKDFRWGKKGLTGRSCQLSGQLKFKDGGKYLLIVGGEEDKAAAYQMLREAQIKRGHSHVPPVAVVSPTTGEGSAALQCKDNYDWIDSFEIIVAGLDNDEKGQEAQDELLKVLPKDKVRVAKWSGKDPNQMLKDGKEKTFVTNFYQAEELVASGIVGSASLREAIRAELLIEKIPLPPFMSELQALMAGGIPLGYIINLVAGTGVGKTTIINEMCYFWIFNSPHTVGILSMELDAGQYGLAMLSRHVGKKLVLMEDPNEALAFLDQPHIKEKEEDLYVNEHGEDRFYLLDETDGDLDQIRKKILRMIIQYDCKFLILDPLQDILDGYDNETQAVFMKWMKQVVKQYKVTVLNINHIRKAGAGTLDRMIVEDDIQGSSSIAKSAGCNIMIRRDKLSDDPIVRNTTLVDVPKLRWTGYTGKGGRWYYDIESHTMYDIHEYFKKYPDQLPAGYDLDAPPESSSAPKQQRKKKPAKVEDDLEIVLDNGVTL